MTSSGAVSFSHRQRVLPCEKCTAALIVPIEGGDVSCNRCSTPLSVPPRPDTTIPPSPATEEKARRERLRAQDGRPMLPPPGLEPLVEGSRIPPHKMQEATLVWSATRKHLASQPGDVAAAERLLWLTLVMVNTLAATQDDATIRGMTEGALEVMMLPRHRQFMRARLARLAARSGDTISAEKWLTGCDPASEDLQTDSSWRLTRAFLDTALRRPDGVLEALGESEADVPIEDSMDAMATVLRAHAWEQRGDVPRARALLARFMTGGGGLAGAVEGVVASFPAEWRVCAQSLDSARGAVREHVGARAAGGGGGAIMGFIIIGAGCVPLVVFAVMVSNGLFQWPMLSMALFPIIFGSWGLNMVRTAFRARAIARDGLHGRGRIVSITPTGTRINHVPVMRLEIELSVEGQERRKASSKRLLSSGQAQALVGRDVGVIWHPKYPDDVVVDL